MSGLQQKTPDDRTWCDADSFFYELRRYVSFYLYCIVFVARWADGDLQSGAADDWQHLSYKLPHTIDHDYNYGRLSRQPAVSSCSASTEDAARLEIALISVRNSNPALRSSTAAYPHYLVQNRFSSAKLITHACCAVRTRHSTWWNVKIQGAVQKVAPFRFLVFLATTWDVHAKFHTLV